MKREVLGGAGGSFAIRSGEQGRNWKFGLAVQFLHAVPDMNTNFGNAKFLKVKKL